MPSSSVAFFGYIRLMSTKSISIFRAAVLLFVFGAIVGNGFNSFHAYSGTIPVTATHMNPLKDWSSYLLFGFAGLSIGMLSIVLDKLPGGNVKPVSAIKALAGIGLLGIFYFLSACMFLSNGVILGLLIFGFLLSYFLYGRNTVSLGAAFLVAIAGTTAEIIFVQSGMYYYSRPQFMGVAYWLPFLYGIASVTTGQLALALAAW